MPGTISNEIRATAIFGIAPLSTESGVVSTSKANRLIVLTRGPLMDEDRALLAFSAWMGIPATDIPVEKGSDLAGLIASGASRGSSCLGVSASSLAPISRDSTAWADLLRSLRDSSATFFVYGWNNNAEHDHLLRVLTGGEVKSIQRSRTSEASFSISKATPNITHQLAGQRFSGMIGRQVCTFALEADAKDYWVIMSAGDQPTFLKWQCGLSEVYLLGTAIADLDQTVEHQSAVESNYSGLIPSLTFFRHVFGERCWHGNQSTARIIIDDPTLNRTYGYLDFDQLTESLAQHNYGVSIAFIPWNWWRTRKEHASKLSPDRSSLAICIHGCDHSNREFAAANEELLNRKASAAVARMQAQKSRTSAPFDPVMVFPQGRFSRAAIRALRRNEFLAAVNSTCLPVDIEPSDIRLGDLLRPAVMSYDGFPIFYRHYPEKLIDFAFDFFLGRPALAVEHHEFFRQGLGKLETFVKEVDRIGTNVSWPSLADQLSRSSIERTLEDGTTEVMFFTREFCLRNDGRNASNFVLLKREPRPELIDRVEIDGIRGEFSVQNGYLRFEVEGGPRRNRMIRIIDQPSVQPAPQGFGIIENSKVMIRRTLSEFRDNTLSRHANILKFAKSAARALRVTGDA